MNSFPSLAESLNGEHFWADLQAQAEIGALSPRGLRRLALDDNDNRARLWLIEQGKTLGCGAYYDAMGNVFLRKEGRDSSQAPLLLGSHLDSQPEAGIYDGTLGVVAGLAVLRTLKEQSVEHARPVEVVAWTNEEGARFAPGTSGSAWFSGQRDPEAILEARDDAGTRFGDALDSCLALLGAHDTTLRAEPYVPHAYLELHIEQGPVLEAQGIAACAVSGIQGVNWYTVEVQGQANHAGTTPEADRRDAFMGAHALITELKSAVTQYDDQVRFTIGKFAMEPGSTNTIPQSARFTIDLRHPDQTVLDKLDSVFHQFCEWKWSGCSVSLLPGSRVAPVAFDPSLVELVNSCATHYCPRAPQLVSGAFHDAIHLAKVCPTAMLFTSCRAGVSHHPDEHVERADAELSVRALAKVVEQLLLPTKANL